MESEELVELSIKEDDAKSDAKSWASRYVKNQNLLLVLEFRADGAYEFREMRRDEILQEARQAIPVDPNEMKLKSIPSHLTSCSMNSDTNSSVGENKNTKKTRHMVTRKKSKGEIYAGTGTLKARDIRLLDPTFSNSHDPSIVVRKHAVLINLEPVKSLILSDRCLLLVPDGADAILTTIMQRLRSGPECSEIEFHETFDVRAMESIFITVCNVLNKELSSLQPNVEMTLSSVLKTGSFNLEKLRLIKKELSLLLAQIRGIQHAFNEVLENDRDMALMSLTKIKENPEYYSEENNDIWEEDHEEMEILLENYVQAVDGTYNQALLLSDEIESTMGLLMVRLDTARNHLLKVELMVSSITSVAAVGALIAGIFGMNLDSGVQDDAYWFWTMAGLLVFGCFSCVLLMFLYIRHKGWLIA